MRSLMPFWFWALAMDMAKSNKKSNDAVFISNLFLIMYRFFQPFNHSAAELFRNGEVYTGCIRSTRTRGRLKPSGANYLNSVSYCLVCVILYKSKLLSYNLLQD